MILHLLTDDKFTDYTIEQFSSVDPHSKFVLIPSNGMMRYVEMQDKCQIIQQDSSEFKELLRHLGDYTAIILHGMHWGHWETPILKQVPDHVKVAWNLWGSDIYGRKDIQDTFLTPLNKFAQRLHNIRTFHGENHDWEIDKALFQRIDYCLADELEEFEYVQKYTGNYRMKHLWYAIFNIEKTLGSLIGSRVNGDNIWFGNCASITANHFDAMYRLLRYGIEDKQVIASLSYNTPWLRNRVSTLGKIIWGKQFVPLTTFLPREEYNRMMLSCGTMIMPAHLPQGHGNILTGLWLGMRVYMSEKSIAYDFFKRIGAHVYSFESDYKTYRYARMTDQEVEESREALRKLYGLDHVMQSVKYIVKELK